MMFMMGLWLVIPLAIIGAVAWVLGWRPQLNQTFPPPTSQTALDILKARYADGEITREEYEQIRQDLEG
jgi:putative membrane protein